MKPRPSPRWQSALALLAAAILIVSFGIKMLHMHGEIAEIETKLARFALRNATAKAETTTRLIWIRAQKEQGQVHAPTSLDALHGVIDQQSASFGAVQTRAMGTARTPIAIATDAGVVIVPVTQKLEMPGAHLAAFIEAFGRTRPGVFSTKITIRPSEALPDQNILLNLDGFALLDQ